MINHPFFRSRTHLFCFCEKTKIVSSILFLEFSPRRVIEPVECRPEAVVVREEGEEKGGALGEESVGHVAGMT